VGRAEQPEPAVHLGASRRRGGRARVDKTGKTAVEHAKDNQKLKGTKVYWQLNDARF
jgi:hypothetical protein